MRMSCSRWAIAGICLCLAVACGPEQPVEPVGASAPSPQTAKPAPAAAPIDKQRPPLQVTTVDGATWSLAAQRGKWIVVNFWATWCSPCLKEMPELSALDAMREHIGVIGLAFEEISAADMQAFLRKHPVTYPVAIIDAYEPPPGFDAPRGLPMTYLIAPDGAVAETFMGPVTAHEIEQAIAKAGGPALQGDAQPSLPAAATGTAG